MHLAWTYTLDMGVQHYEHVNMENPIECRMHTLQYINIFTLQVKSI